MKYILLTILLLTKILTFSQGNGQPCSNNCVECSGILVCEDCICTIKPLPIELTNFSVEFNVNKNIVKWVTNSENNNYYFELYRSIDCKNWEPIALVFGEGNSSIPSSYALLDYTFKKAVNYYQLKQVDFDGKYEYFDIIAIDNSIEDEQVVYRVNLYGAKIVGDYKGMTFDIFKNGIVKKKIYE